MKPQKGVPSKKDTHKSKSGMRQPSRAVAYFTQRILREASLQPASAASSLGDSACVPVGGEPAKSAHCAWPDILPQPLRLSRGKRQIILVQTFKVTLVKHRPTWWLSFWFFLKTTKKRGPVPKETRAHRFSVGIAVKSSDAAWRRGFWTAVRLARVR